MLSSDGNARRTHRSRPVAASSGSWSPLATDLDEVYDLVVVGAGISGLAAAYYYRRRFGLMDNHDDFGGHARRNEFHQGGRMRLAWGGTMNLEYPQFSAAVNQLLAELGVDIPRLKRAWISATATPARPDRPSGSTKRPTAATSWCARRATT